MAKAKQAATPKAKGGRRQIKIISVVVAVALVITVIQCGRQLIQLSNLTKQRNEYQVAYEEVVAQKAVLEENKALLSDSTYLTRLARERFHYVKPNEYLVVPAEQNSEVEASGDISDNDIH